MNATKEAAEYTANTPRSLAQTEQRWYSSNGGQSIVYNTPVETGKLLDASQGKLPDYQGTCGIVSCVNVLRLAGRLTTTEEELVRYASTAANETNPLCVCGETPFRNGGTGPDARKELLSAFGVESELLPPSIDRIAEYVEAGRGVIVSVDAGKLWRRPRFYRCLHAVTVTSVQRSRDGSLEGFYLCDSGTSGTDCAHFYLAAHLKQALSPRMMNVTASIIR